MNREGYWTTGEDSDLPSPVAREWAGRERFLARLTEIETTINEVHPDQIGRFRGFSHCRICEKRNGSTDFTYGSWNWPSGYRHYIQEHGVRPSLAFEEFIIGERVK